MMLRTSLKACKYVHSEHYRPGKKKNIGYLKKNRGKTVINKVEKLLVELIEHPKTGIGQVEQLKGDRQGQWSRRIDKKNRLVYSIDDEIVTVEVISAKSHYGDR